MAQSRANSRANTQQTAEEQRPIEGDFLEHDSDPADEDAHLDLTNLLADIGDPSDTAVHVYRQKEGTKKLSWIHTFSPSDLDIGSLFHSLRHEMGGGMFRLQVRENGRIVKSKTVEIEPPTKKEAEAVNSNMFGGFDPVAMLKEMRDGGGNNSQMEFMMQMMMQQSRDTQALVGKLIEAQASGGRDQPTMRDMVETLVSMQQLSGGQQKENPIDLFIKGVELAKEFGGSDKETNFFDVLGKSLSTFGSTLTQAMNTGMPGQQAFAPQQETPRIQYNPQVQNSEARPTMQPGQESQPDQSTQETAQEFTPLPDDHPLKAYEAYILWLIDLAEKDRDPETYANVIVDQLGEDAARTLFTEEQYLKMVAQAFPQMQKHANWFNELISAVDEFTSAEDDGQSSESHSNRSEEPSDNVAQKGAALSFAADPDDNATHGPAGGAGGDQENAADNGNVSESGKDGNAST